MAGEVTSKKEMIKNAAIKSFAKSGYYHCRISDIAREARVAHGLIYHYFSSKEDVLLYIFQSAWNNLLEYVNSIEQGKGDPLGKIEAVMEFMFKSFKNNMELMKILIMDIPRSDKFYNRENQELYNSVFMHIANIIGDGQQKSIFKDDMSPMVVSHILLGVVDSIIRQYVYNSYFEWENIAIGSIINQTTGVLFHGIRR